MLGINIDTSAGSLHALQVAAKLTSGYTVYVKKEWNITLYTVTFMLQGHIVHQQLVM